MHGLGGVRRPLAQAAAHAGAGGESVVQDVGIIVNCSLDLLGYWRDHRNTGGHRGGEIRRRTGPGHDGVVDQSERLVYASMYLHRGTAGVAGERGYQPGTLTWDRALLRGRQGGIRKYLYRSGFHQRGQIGRPLGRVLPHVATVWHGDMGAGKDARSVGRKLGGEPVWFASELRRRNIRIVVRGDRSGE